MEINGYNNYLLFRNGAVLSKGNKYNKPRFLKPYKCKHTGYLMVNLFCDGKQRYSRIHRLVAEHFIPKIEGKNFVDHINRNKLDNRICNLRWVTQRQNNENQSMRSDNTSGHKNIVWDKPRNKWRLQITRNGIKTMKRFNKLEEAIELRDKIINTV
jgi:hypothetical protein